MDYLTAHIPPSLQVYADQFDDDPGGTILKLEQHVTRRNIGAVGYYFLAHFCHKNGDKEKARQYAWTAKILAPGSPNLEYFHYFITHPDSFEAWKPENDKPAFKKDFHKNDRPHPIQDLDNLINRLSSVESERIRLSETEPEEGIDLGQDSSKVDDIVTETLAHIHEMQNNYNAAIRTYERLIKSDPARESHYNDQIFRLKQKKSEEDSE